MLASPQHLGANPSMQVCMQHANPSMQVWPPGLFRCQGELGERHSHQQACRQERHELIFSLPTQCVWRELGKKWGGKN